MPCNFLLFPLSIYSGRIEDLWAIILFCSEYHKKSFYSAYKIHENEITSIIALLFYLSTKGQATVRLKPS